ncbi:galactosyltransferase-related protein [Neobacillus sp. 114]|uniref:galactosyltransferase-related protein n=1 Tax=Neobacillus sp. 114 TaxID=3048535 RepID=UPI0024C3474D|nr:galactosyltransferase-related protein [Neobacillus sp. 114]
MLENVSIIIPFQTDNGPRAKAFEWIKKYYARVMPEAELCLGIISGDINKAKAINLAAKKATKDIFVIADADVVYAPSLIEEAIKVLKKAAWVVPFTEIYNVEKQGTKKLLQTKPKWPMDVNSGDCSKANWLYQGFAGKLFVIPRANFEAVGGFDERFIGWGGEDDAFSHSVRTLCGDIVNVKGRIYHLWHPSSSYQTNPNGKANANLLGRYERASGNIKKMAEIINERLEKDKTIKIDNENSGENESTASSNSKICFAILVHEDRELVKQLIDNVRYYCPSSTIVLYNGGEDPKLCEGLGVPVCPSSHKLKRGWTTIYFLETMEWLEKQGIQYDYFINIDSDALFIRKGYEEFVQKEMKDTDYMAVKLRIPKSGWYIGKELKKDINRWKKLFNVNPFYGVFNVGQVISRPLVQALLKQERLEKLKNALIKTISFGTDEVLFVNMAKELGFRLKKYPNETASQMIRYRPYFTLDEMISCLNNNETGGLCHPVIRANDDPVRKLILHMNSDIHTKRFKTNDYPWHDSDPKNYSITIPIKSKFGNDELIVRSGSFLTHYWQDPDGKWNKSETFATNVVGTPIFFQNNAGQFVVVCKLKTGNIGFWLRDNEASGYPWYGRAVSRQENVDELIMGTQLQDNGCVIVYKSNNKFYYWEFDKKIWKDIFPK